MNEIITKMQAKAGKEIEINPELANILPEIKFGKGYLIAGNTGSGKTLLASCLPSNERGTYLIPAMHIVREFQNVGIDFIGKLNLLVPAGWACGHLVIDDLGSEPIANYYGNKAEACELFIDEFYRKYQTAKLVLSITTNLTMNEIRERYGSRCYYRIMEMCKIVYLGKGKDYVNYRAR
jgi:DNA replication protein DnaC